MMRLVFIVVGALAMFGAVFAYNTWVHTPLIAGLCASSCAKAGMGRTLKREGYNRSASTSCMCVARAGGEPQYKKGYFLVPAAWLDWFWMIWVRLIPLGFIVGVFIYVIAKIVPRIPSG